MATNVLCPGGARDSAGSPLVQSREGSTRRASPGQPERVGDNLRGHEADCAAEPRPSPSSLAHHPDGPQYRALECGDVLSRLCGLHLSVVVLPLFGKCPWV